MSKPILAALSCAVLLSACAEQTPITTPPANVTYTSAQAKQNIASLDPVAIRSVYVVEKNGRKAKTEFSGARCNVVGTGFKGQVTSPGILKVPTYLGRTDPITVRCAANGQNPSLKVNAVNATATQSAPIVPGGLLGALVATAVTAAAKASRDPAKDQFDYPGSVSLPFNPPAAE